MKPQQPPQPPLKQQWQLQKPPVLKQPLRLRHYNQVPSLSWVSITFFIHIHLQYLINEYILYICSTDYRSVTVIHWNNILFHYVGCCRESSPKIQNEISIICGFDKLLVGRMMHYRLRLIKVFFYFSLHSTPIQLLFGCGNSLRMVSASDISACESGCNARSDCDGFTFKNGRCYLKPRGCNLTRVNNLRYYRKN